MSEDLKANLYVAGGINKHPEGKFSDEAYNVAAEMKKAPPQACSQVQNLGIQRKVADLIDYQKAVGTYAAQPASSVPAGPSEKKGSER